MNSTLYVKRMDGGVTVDLSEDFTLPDYVPEVRRVIGVRANSTVDGKYISGDELEADGAVTYTVLYVGGDGAITQTSQSSQYTGRIPLKTDDDRFTPNDLVTWSSAEQAGCRVTAPRKITLTSRVRLNCLSQKPVDCALKSDGAALRKRCETHNAAALTEVRVNGECGGELREKAGTKVVMAGAELALADVRIHQSRLSVKGDCYMTALLLSPEGEYVTARGRAPMEDEIPLPDGVSPNDAHAAAFGKVVLIEVETGDDGVLAWRVEYDIDCDVMKCSTAETAADAYLTEWQDEAELSELESHTPAAMVNGRLTTGGTVKMRPEMKYVCAWGSGSVDRAEITGGRMTLGGGVKLSVVTAGEGETVLEDVQIPLRYECEALPGAKDGNALSGRYAVSVTDVSARPEGDTLNLTVELAISAAVLGTEPVRYVSAIARTGDAVTKKKNLLRVYVPDEGETAWDVEKRFRLSGSAAAEGKAYVI